MAEYSGPAVGAEAVEKADAESNLRSAESFYQSDALSGESNNGVQQPVVKYVDDKTFLIQNGIWIDTTYEPGSMETTKIGFGTQVYFDLLKSRPSFGKYLALGNQLIFVIGGTAYEIVEGEGELESLPSQLSQPEGESQSNMSENLPDSATLRQPFKLLRTLCAAPFLAGLADVDAITLSIAGLTKSGQGIALQTGRILIVLATISNTAAKGILVFSLGSRSLRKYIWPVMVIMLVIGLVFIFIF